MRHRLTPLTPRNTKAPLVRGFRLNLGGNPSQEFRVCGFLDGTLALMERCDAVVLINGWRYSAGTLGEVHRARELGMPIFACLEDLPTAEEFSGMTVVNAHDLVTREAV